MMNDPLNSFLNELQSNLNKLVDKTNNMCSRLDKMEERFLNMEIKLEANKLVHQEKIESSNYKLSVLEEKINGNIQKVNELNNILMKHFAYKNNKNPQSTTTPQQSIIPQTTIPQSNSTPQTTTTTIPNPFAMPNFGAK